MVHWLLPSLHKQKGSGFEPTGQLRPFYSFLGVCVFFQCQHGFPPDTLVSFYKQKCEWECEWLLIDWQPVQDVHGLSHKVSWEWLELSSIFHPKSAGIGSSFNLYHLPMLISCTDNR